MTEHYYAEQPHSEAKFGLIRTQLRGRPFEFVTAPSVFSIKRVDLGTHVLIEAMQLPEEGCVLDIGCGYGAIGIAAAKFNPNLHVVLTDVNRRAVLLARQNIQKNRVPNAEAKHGTLYNPVQNCAFNCILSNPPVSAGMKTVEAIIRGAPAVMAGKATFQMVVRSKIGRKTLPKVFEETFGNFAVLARESGYRVIMAEKQ
jgi:16S rRNA G1207 methylase RsmC